MSVYVWLYRSRAANPLKSSEILDLLNSSRRNNTRLGLTGMLLYHNDCFTQVLEGDKASVIDMKDNISGDSLHKDVDTLYEGEWPDRIFTTWSMGFHAPTDLEREQLEVYLPLDWAARTLSSVDIEGQLHDAFQIMSEWALQA